MYHAFFSPRHKHETTAIEGGLVGGVRSSTQGHRTELCLTGFAKISQVTLNVVARRGRGIRSPESPLISYASAPIN